MEERNNNNNNDGEKVGDDEVMLPGFRFHPTDEELVGFYLRRKIQQRPLSIELIKQLDIYKYDPWDLPKLASTGEKEWYFYCPRDRKYRNSARPNRVTGAGFWKATGTDRPIYSSSSEGSSSSSKCIIGLKKSLVFYKGRAAKGVKTDWMMHEFRLPSHSSSSSLLSQNKYLDNTIIPPNESWAICKIFKKTNSTTQRALCQSWVFSLLPPTAEPTTPDHNNNNNIQTKDNNPQEIINTQFCSSTTNNNIFPLTKKPNCCLDVSNHFCPLDVTAASYKSIINPLIYYKALDHFYLPFSSSNGGDHNNSNSFIFSSSDNGSSTTNTNFGGLPQIGIHQFYDDANNDAMVKLNNNNLNVNNNNNVHGGVDEQDLETLRSFGFPFGVPLNIAGDAWKSNYNNVHWDASSCPSYSTTKCYT